MTGQGRSLPGPGVEASQMRMSGAARGVLRALLAGGQTRAAPGPAAAELAGSGWVVAGAGTLRPDAALLMGCDVGGTKVHSVLADLEGRCITDLREATAPEGGAALVAQIVRHRDRLLAQAGPDAAPLLAAGVGVPGAVDGRTGRVCRMPNIAGLQEADLRGVLAGALGLPVGVENDVNLAAQGEYWLGHRAENMAFLALGTGIGLGQMVNGAMLRGARGAAGEVATLPIGASPFDPATFATGALESTVSAASLVAAFESAGGSPGRTLEDLFAADEPRFRAILDGLAERLALAVMSVAAITAPEIVVFGGSVGQRQDLVDRVTAHLKRVPQDSPDCRISRLGNRAGVLGAVWLARQTLAEHLPGA